jgi:hypothetical protein
MYINQPKVLGNIGKGTSYIFEIKIKEFYLPWILLLRLALTFVGVNASSIQKLNNISS